MVISRKRINSRKRYGPWTNVMLMYEYNNFTRYLIFTILKAISKNILTDIQTFVDRSTNDILIKTTRHVLQTWKRHPGENVDFSGRREISLRKSVCTQQRTSMAQIIVLWVQHSSILANIFRTSQQMAKEMCDTMEEKTTNTKLNPNNADLFFLITPKIKLCAIVRNLIIMWFQKQCSTQISASITK